MASAAAELVAEREPEPRSDIVVDANLTFIGAEGLVRMALDQYTEILTTVSDPRVSDWPLMDSPIPTFLIVVSYLYSVTILGPRLMANRKPFQLRNTLVAYNAFQVIFSLGMLYEDFITPSRIKASDREFVNRLFSEHLCAYACMHAHFVQSRALHRK